MRMVSTVGLASRFARSPASLTAVSSGFERIEYDVPGLSEEDADPDPFNQFDLWFRQAAHLTESNTMILATASKDGRPAARAVLMKGYDHRGVVFFTNRASQKGRHLTENPVAEACFVWQPLHRQVRISGPVGPIERAESDAYWSTRPRDAQIASSASRQSSVLRSRDEFRERVSAMESEWSEVDRIPRPDYWGGFRIHPETIEFLRHAIKDAVERYEPRLQRVRVMRQPVEDEGEGRLVFLLSGHLVGGARVQFQTTFSKQVHVDPARSY